MSFPIHNLLIFPDLLYIEIDILYIEYIMQSQLKLLSTKDIPTEQIPVCQFYYLSFHFGVWKRLVLMVLYFLIKNTIFGVVVAKAG